MNYKINRLKIKGIRVEKGLSQKELAKEMNMPLSTYCAKEQGKNEFTESEIVNLSIILNKSIEYFFEN